MTLLHLSAKGWLKINDLIKNPILRQKKHSRLNSKDFSRARPRKESSHIEKNLKIWSKDIENNGEQYIKDEWTVKASSLYGKFVKSQTRQDAYGNFQTG
jgi:hypothetical protein